MATNKQPKPKNTYVVFLLGLVFATMICFGVSGGSPRLHDILLFWLLWNLIWLKPLFFKIISPLLLLWLLYSPIGIQYGYPNAGMIASLFGTTTNEVKEFFDPKTLIYLLITIGLSIFMFLLTKNIKASQKQYKFFRYFSAIIALLFIANMVGTKPIHIKWRYSELLNIIPHTLAEYRFYLTNQQKMKELRQLKDDWQVISYQPKYQTYVLVLGESASKDYLSPYGYPVKNSPFLEQAHGIKYTQMFAPAAHTIKSIPRLLTIPNAKEVEYQNNIINLANHLGIKTYWISNQDKMGEYENEISYLANYSQEQYYLSEVAPTTARYDHQMLPKITSIINAPSDTPKLIIVHLMGSHTRFVKRVDFNKAHFNFDDKHLSDYLSSLLQTDMFLENLHQELKDSKQSFSMIYVSDHGLNPITLRHGISQFTPKVPLFKLSSDDTMQTHDDNIISGFSFVWFLTEWLGIDTQNQSQNTFLNHYRMANLEELQIFDDESKSYLSLEPFDGKLLLPSHEELTPSP